LVPEEIKPEIRSHWDNPRRQLLTDDWAGLIQKSARKTGALALGERSPAISSSLEAA
jgi:hypothetical protein